MIGPRARRLREELVDVGVGPNGNGPVAQIVPQLDRRRLVLEFVPFALEILLQEVAIGNKTQLGGNRKRVAEPLAMLAKNAAAEFFLGHEHPAVAAEVVAPLVEYEP